MIRQLLLSASLGLVLAAGTPLQSAQAQAAVIAAPAAQTVIALGELPIRENPPGPLSSRGDEINRTVRNARYQILSRKVVPSVYGAQLWVQVQPANGGRSGWVYAGKARSGSPRNFQPVGRN